MRTRAKEKLSLRGSSIYALDRIHAGLAANVGAADDAACKKISRERVHLSSATRQAIESQGAVKAN